MEKKEEKITKGNKERDKGKEIKQNEGNIRKN